VAPTGERECAAERTLETADAVPAIATRGIRASGRAAGRTGREGRSACRLEEDWKMRKTTILKLLVLCVAFSAAPLVVGCSEDTITSPAPGIENTTPPLPPTDIQILRRDQGVTVTWSPSPAPDVVGYNVWLYCPSPDKVQAYEKLNSELVTGTRFGAKILPTTGPEYYFRVTAVDARGNESPFSSTVRSDPPIAIE